MRRLLLISLAVLLVAGGAIVLVPMLIPAEIYKAEIAKAVEKATGRSFRIAGGVKLEVLPRVHASLEKASLANAPGGKAPWMAEIGRLSVGLKLWPLLSRQVEISSFVLEDAVIHLEVDASGAPNWEFAAAKGTAAEDSVGGAKEAGVKEISLGDVRLVNAQVTYEDRKTGSSYEVSRIGAKIELPSLDAPFKLAGDATYKGESIHLNARVAKARTLLEGGTSDLSVQAKSALLNTGFDGAATFGAKLALSGESKLDSPSVRKFAQWLGTPISGQTGFGPLSVSGKTSLEGNRLSFENAQVHFDKMDATGALVADLGGARPRITGHLQSPKLDLRPYTGGGDAPAAAGQTEKATQTEWSSEPIDASGLRSFNAKLDLEADEILVRDVKIGKSQLAATVEDGTLTADLKELGLYQGIAKGRLVVDGRKTPGSLSSTLSLSGLDLSSFLADAAKSNRFEGTGNFNIDLKGAGHSQKELVENLGGTTKIAFQNGAIRGIDLAKIAALVQGLTGNTSAKPETPADASASEPNAPPAEAGQGAGERTKFVALGANFAVTQGVMRTTDFSMINDLISLSGQGAIDLVHQTIDFRVEPGRDQKNGGLRVALRITGPLSHPKIVPDASGLIQSEIEKRLGKSPAGDILDQILGGKKSAEPRESPDAQKLGNEKPPAQLLIEQLLGGKPKSD
jgi:AsmA protein